jgi:glutamyl-tRNA reductase
MHLFLLGVNHRTAPVDLRERLDFSTRGLDRALAALAIRPGSSEAAIVSTCNRAEVYVATDDPEAARGDLAGFLSEFHELSPDVLAPHLHDAVDGDAARHLFRVAAGLDSLVMGEPQILGQVKDAYSAASEQHCVGPLLNKVFHWSFIVGKRVRSETRLGEGAVSVSFAAVALARKIFGSLNGRHVLVVGAGEMSKLTALHLKGQGISRIVVTSRTTGHAAQLADEIGGVALPWAQMTSALGEADIIISATGATVPILSRATIAAAIGPRRNRPLFVIDIAVPRDVESAAGEIEEVFLYNIDDLQAVIQENLTRRAAEIDRAEQIVGQEVENFCTWLRSRRAVPTVVALRQRFEAIRRSELERLQPKMASLPPDARARVDDITRLIIEKLLLTPTEQLKSIPDPDVMVAYSDALTRLFGLEEDGEDGRGAFPIPFERRRRTRRTAKP